MPDEPRPDDPSLLDDLGDVPLSLMGAVVKLVVGGFALAGAVFGIFSLIGRRRS